MTKSGLLHLATTLYLDAVLIPQREDGTVSEAYRTAISRVERYAKFEAATIFLEGESGTGKSTIARIIHVLSPRASAEFVAADLASMDESIAGSELFGHVPGAFTSAQRKRQGLVATAQGGTLFLDELGKAPKSIQHRLLALLEGKRIRPLGADREVPMDVRIVAAANERLEDLIVAGSFIHELLPRLGGFRIRLPSLRERRDDIPALARACVRRHSQAFGYTNSEPVLHASLVEALQCANWPYNIRELDNMIQRILADAEGAPVLTVEHCRYDLAHLRLVETSATARERITPEIAARAVKAAGSISRAAVDLNVARSTVQRQLRKGGNAPTEPNEVEVLRRAADARPQLN